MVFTIFFISLLMLFGFLCFLTLRNDWVCHQRIAIIHDSGTNGKEYVHGYLDANYWTYEQMLYHVWIWDVEKMRFDYAQPFSLKNFKIVIK